MYGTGGRTEAIDGQDLTLHFVASIHRSYSSSSESIYHTYEQWFPLFNSPFLEDADVKT
jgi:hypothetical protein